MLPAPERNIVCALCAFLVFILSASHLPGQERDSLRFYKKIKHAAYKYRLTRLAYEAVFVDPEPKEYPAKPEVSIAEKHVNPYLLYPGKIIRRINVTVLDPFGNSVNDTTPKKLDAVQKMGNRLHVTTRRWVILNRLLFQENDTVNPLVFSESERVLRQAVFVNDARVFISPTASRDSVDVNVIVLDKWPVTVPVFVSDVSANILFQSTNLFGLGQQFAQFFGVSRPYNYDISTYYSIANIDRTFITANMSYAYTSDYTKVALGFDRPFYSPLAKWAGGVYASHTWRQYPYAPKPFHEASFIPLNQFAFDVYLAKTIKFSNKQTLFNQSTNMIVGLRHFQNIFLNRPSEEIDSVRANINNGAVIGNVGVAIQQFYKDKYIFRFGANEDVPEGLLIQFIYGGLKREYDKERLYTGIEVAKAKHFQIGYLSATLAYGVFYNTKLANDITTNLRLNYFSQLMRGGRWYFRQFCYYTFVHGENKLAGDRITLRGDELYGFQNTPLSGNTKMVLNSETVAYMPYNLVGFRFAPVLMAAVGIIGNKESSLYRSRLYQGYSLGVMFRNENLLSSTFQISVGFYPILPDGRKNLLIYNPVTSFTVKVRTFQVHRPDFVPYN